MDSQTDFSVAAPAVHDYYDDLKVTRDAPPEVIRAAYRALAQKYHPDRHQGSAAHAGILATLNKAQQVLLDPAQRAEHDRWLRTEQRRLRTPSAPWEPPLGLASGHERTLLLARGNRPIAGMASGLRQRIVLGVVGLLLIGMLVGAVMVVFAEDNHGARSRAVSCGPMF